MQDRLRQNRCDKLDIREFCVRKQPRDFFGKKRERGKTFRKEKETKTFLRKQKNPLNYARVFRKFRLLSNIKFTNVKFVTPVCRSLA